MVHQPNLQWHFSLNYSLEDNIFPLATRDNFFKTVCKGAKKLELRIINYAIILRKMGSAIWRLFTRARLRSRRTNFRLKGIALGIVLIRGGVKERSHHTFPPYPDAVNHGAPHSVQG